MSDLAICREDLQCLLAGQKPDDPSGRVYHRNLVPSVQKRGLDLRDRRFGADRVRLQAFYRTTFACGTFATCGRVMSPRSSASQLRGGVVWAISAALREASEVDPRYGGWLNNDLAD